MWEQIPSSKWWKWLTSLTMITLPSIFEMNFVEVWKSSQTLWSFIISSWVPGAVLMSPNSTASFLLRWHKWNTFSSSSTSCSTNFSIYGTYSASYMSPDNLFSSAQISIIWGWSWSSTTNVCTSLVTSIHVQPHCFFSPLSFLCCSTFSQRCLSASAAAHNLQHFQAPFQKFV